MGYARFSLAMMETAKHLRSRSVPWAGIADRFGCCPKSMKVMYSRWQRGTKGRGWHHEEYRRQLIAACEAGLTTREMADHFGRSIQSVCSTLAYHGYDAEVRAMYRADSHKRNYGTKSIT